jgi:hypothetical protein
MKELPTRSALTAPAQPLVYSAGRRRRMMRRLLTFVALGVAGPFAGALTLKDWLIPAGHGWLAGVLLAFTSGWILFCARHDDYLCLWGNDQIREEVGQKLRANGAAEAVEDGIWTGMTPGDELRYFDGESDWDVGFLLIRPGLLTFVGDRCSWALRPDQVTRIRLTQTEAEPRTLVYWKDEATGTEGVFSLNHRDPRRLGHVPPGRLELERRLRAWRGESAAVPTIEMGLPPTEVMGGIPHPGLSFRMFLPAPREEHSTLPRPAAPPSPAPEQLPVAGGDQFSRGATPLQAERPER